MNLRLVHGWVVTPETPAALAIGSLGYNQLQETLINYHIAKESDSSDPALAGGAVISQFLEETASQLTHEGLVRLHDQLHERELVVFFRNNHFSTILKVVDRQYQGCIFLLATDEGFAHENRIVWEKLNEVSGDTTYCNSEFEAVRLTEDEQFSQHRDYEEALRLQEMENKAKQEEEDLALAKKMQAEMDLPARPPQQPKMPLPPKPPQQPKMPLPPKPPQQPGNRPPSSPQAASQHAQPSINPRSVSST